MNFNNNQRDEKSFPELLHDARDPRQENRSRPADWREQPLEARPESHIRETSQGTEVRNSGGARTGPLWLALTFLLVVLAGASIYGYETLQDQSTRLDQVPAMLKSMATADGRLDTVESQLRSWPGYWQGLAGRMGKLEKRVRANYLRTRQHAEELTAQLGKQIQDQMEARNRVVDAHLDQLDSGQKNAQARIAELRQELADAHQEIASLRQETNGDLALLHQHVAGNEQQVNDLTQQVARDRVTFEVDKNQIAQLSPDISMDLTATDVPYQRFSGWVYFEPDRRFLWVRNQGVTQPVIFYDQAQARQYQVVVTSLRDGSAAGYLLVPHSSRTLSSEYAGGAPSGK
jgi:hypothetical protein